MKTIVIGDLHGLVFGSRKPKIGYNWGNEIEIPGAALTAPARVNGGSPMTAPQSTPARDLPQEEWRDLPGFAGAYLVSNMGRIKRGTPARGTQVGRILKTPCNPDGYPSAVLRRDNVTVNVSVHRSVALAFLGVPPEDRPEVNHKNGNRADNRVANLEFCTRSQNVTHSFRILGRKANSARGERNSNHKLTAAQVVEVRRLYEQGLTQEALGLRYGVAESTIGKIVRRERWKEVA